jgi:hypothetical protein
MVFSSTTKILSNLVPSTIRWMAAALYLFMTLPDMKLDSGLPGMPYCLDMFLLLCRQAQSLILLGPRPGAPQSVEVVRKAIQAGGFCEVGPPASRYAP